MTQQVYGSRIEAVAAGDRLRERGVTEYKITQLADGRAILKYDEGDQTNHDEQPRANQ